MRTIIVIFLGLVVLFIMEGVSRLIATRHETQGHTSFNAPILFIRGWFIFIVVDYLYGVFVAGYSAIVELGIHAILFAIPALAALMLLRRRR